MKRKNGDLTLWEKFPVLEACAIGVQTGVFGAIGGALAGGLVGLLAGTIPAALAAAVCGVAVIGTVATAVTALAMSIPMYRPSETFGVLGAGFATTAALAAGIHSFQPAEAPAEKTTAATHIGAVFTQSAAPGTSTSPRNAPAVLKARPTVIGAVNI